jgi:hypothetical protein
VRAPRGSYSAAQSWQQARRAWEAGLIVPHRITLALDARGLYGPDVDLECGALEPAVDEWEAGTRYPTWEQLLKLARLCQAPPAFFAVAPTPQHGPVILCSRGRGRGCRTVEVGDIVERFTPQAIATPGVGPVQSIGGLTVPASAPTRPADARTSPQLPPPSCPPSCPP